MTLLEEPQAALYSWIQQSAGGWRKQVRPATSSWSSMSAAAPATFR
jgi:hypothetical protein